MNELMEPEVEEPIVRKRVPGKLEAQPAAAEFNPPELYLFGTIIRHPEYPRLRYCWLGVRMTVAGAVSAATMEMRVYGLDSRSEHVTDIWQFGRLAMPGTEPSNIDARSMFDGKLVAAWVQSNMLRDILLINSLDSAGRPIFSWPPGIPSPREQPLAS